KHNEANGEDNNDGTDDNRSWNCGAEGETDDPEVLALRHRQAKNLMATLLLAAGTPMITAGDEFGRTQEGNNNAYCQDSPISWVHWSTLDEWQDLHDLTATLLDLRTFHPCLRPDRYRHGAEVAEGRLDLAWFSGTGEMTQDDWNDGARRHLGVYVSDEQSAFCLWFHSGADPVTVTLPDAPWAYDWTVRAHTGGDDEFDTNYGPGAELELPGRTVLVLQGRV